MSKSKGRLRRWFSRIGLMVVALAAGPLLMAACGDINLQGDWRTANRDSAGIAPPAAQTPEAMVQVYAGRAFRWRGIFGVHTWIAAKPPNAQNYTVYQVMGWYARHGGSSIVSRVDVPDRNWYGARPQLLADLRGDAAASAIPKIESAIANYPHEYEYVLWPGPNSNTFVAHVVRQVPELVVDFPPTAIGKDYLPDNGLVATAPSGTGYQISLAGLVGVMAAIDEGLELNVLGLSLGVDPLGLALKVPGLGRVGKQPY